MMHQNCENIENPLEEEMISSWGMKTARHFSDNVRDIIVSIGYFNKASHIGSCLSCVEIISSLFYLKYSKNLIDKIVLSKGHAVLAEYAVANEFGLLSYEKLKTYNQNGTTLMGHASKSPELPFIDFSTGSLGHGISAAAGFAYINKYINKSNKAVACICGDGEMNEGSFWEAIMFAAHHKLDNLIVIIDNNKWQALGQCDNIINMNPMLAKFEAFNWKCKIRDGHNCGNLIYEIKDYILLPPKLKGYPFCIIANTVKGKGIRQMENTLESHYKSITTEQYEEYFSNSNNKKEF